MSRATMTSAICCSISTPSRPSGLINSTLGRLTIVCGKCAIVCMKVRLCHYLCFPRRLFGPYRCASSRASS
jgi:hypothetical protein